MLPYPFVTCVGSRKDFASDGANGWQSLVSLCGDVLFLINCDNEVVQFVII